MKKKDFKREMVAALNSHLINILLKKCNSFYYMGIILRVHNVIMCKIATSTALSTSGYPTQSGS